MRNRYLDLLRAVAIVRVVVYHLFGWPWLSVLLPAMGIMFALAGSLTAASMEKRAGTPTPASMEKRAGTPTPASTETRAGTPTPASMETRAAVAVVRSRLRRLLPPLWLLGAIAVPAMLAAGWAQEEDGAHPFSPVRLAFWILPLGDPPGSDRAIDVWEPLWYVRAYLWFVLLSPLLYPLYRRLGWLLVAAPIALIAVLDKTGFALPETADAAMWDFATYGACWLAGFAHRDGRLRRVRPAALAGAAVALGAAALAWLAVHPGEAGYDLNDVSESQALWSLAVVLVVLRWQPRMDRPDRPRALDRAVTLLNNRAVTVYLWHNIAIALTFPVLGYLALDDMGGWDGPLELAMALLLTAGAVLAFGWAEDLAARRRPRLWPATAAGREPAGGDGVQPASGMRPASGKEPARRKGPARGKGPAGEPDATLPESVLRLARGEDRRE